MNKFNYSFFQFDLSDFAIQGYLWPSDLSEESHNDFLRDTNHFGDLSSVDFSLYSRLYCALEPCFRCKEEIDAFRQFWNGVSNVAQNKLVFIGPYSFGSFSLYKSVTDICSLDDLNKIRESGYSFSKRISYLRHSAHMNMLDLSDELFRRFSDRIKDTERLRAWIDTRLLIKMMNYEVSLQYEIAKEEIENYTSSGERFNRNIEMLDVAYDIWRSDFEKNMLIICPLYRKPIFAEVVRTFEEKQYPIRFVGSPFDNLSRGHSYHNPWNTSFGFGDEAETAYWNTE